MWNLKCTIIPVITGATGIVTRSLRKNLEAVPGKYSRDSLQKTAILGRPNHRWVDIIIIIIIPIIIGATGIVTRSLRKNLEAVPGKHAIDSLQKTAILGTSHIIRKVLQCEA